MQKHKWYNEIVAWASGAEIESRKRYRSNDEFDEWELNKNPAWSDDIRVEYRIKPQPKEPQYLYAYRSEDGELDISYTEPKRVILAGWECLGKIKLETDND